MGKPVMLLDANKLWYWNNRRGFKSLWYPSVKIFQRENMNASWDLQVSQVEEELKIRYGICERMHSHFAFFYAGQDISGPQKMVKSILRYNPDALITMFTDEYTPDVMGVTDRMESQIDRNNLMHSRVRAYAERAFNEPVLYLDTDMIVQDKIVVKDLLGDKDTALCRRSFERETLFNPNQLGIKFPEYEGKTLYEVYPYVGCAVVSRKNGFWKSLLNIYNSLNPKFRKWYGDQEALRIYAEKYPELITEIHESVYGCLPEENHDGAKILHYKGQARKKLFEEL